VLMLLPLKGKYNPNITEEVYTRVCYVKNLKLPLLLIAIYAESVYEYRRKCKKWNGVWRVVVEPVMNNEGIYLSNKG